jgi:hypothetical protein
MPPRYWATEWSDAIAIALDVAYYHGMKCSVYQQKGEWVVKVIGTNQTHRRTQTEQRS